MHLLKLKKAKGKKRGRKGKKGFPSDQQLWASLLGDSVATVNTEVGASDIVGGVGQKEGHGAHEVLGGAHLALGDEGGPLPLEGWVVVENLLGAVVIGGFFDQSQNRNIIF